MKALKEFKHLRQQGYTLTELLTVIGIVVVTGVAITVFIFAIKLAMKALDGGFCS